MELRISCLLLAIMLLQGVKALTCSSGTLKITIKTLPEEYEFDEYEQYEMRATIAYAVQKYCGDASLDACNGGAVYLISSNVTLDDITERISMCVAVDSFDPDTVRTAIKISKANLNGALLLTDEDLYVDGILPTLSPVPEYDFEPWLIAYIVVFCLIILGGVAVLLYTKFHKSEDSEEKEQILAVEEGSVEDLSGNTNSAYEEVQDVVPPRKLIEEKSSLGYHDERSDVLSDQAVEEATAL